ncbi:MAG TPA: transposase, partial [Leptolyngbyaceae cyanobacterium]
MTPNPRKKASSEFNLGKIKGKEIIANFSGGRITSNAGIVLIAELDKKLKISHRFADSFQDYRNSSYIDYSVEQLVTQ